MIAMNTAHSKIIHYFLETTYNLNPSMVLNIFLNVLLFSCDNKYILDAVTKESKDSWSKNFKQSKSIERNSRFSERELQ